MADNTYKQVTYYCYDCGRDLTVADRETTLIAIFPCQTCLKSAADAREHKLLEEGKYGDE